MSKHLRLSRFRCNKIQKEMLISFMAKNRDLARGVSLDKDIERQRWEILQRELAKVGHPRTVEQWKITWRDLKSRGRQRILPRPIRRSLKTTPNVKIYQNVKKPLSDEDKQILSIIGEPVPDNSNNNITVAQEIAVRESSSVTPCRYQDILALLPEAEVGDTDTIQIEVSDSSRHPKCPNIKTEVVEHKLLEERDDPLSNSSPSAANNFEDEVELEEANYEEPECIDENYSVEQESDKEVNDDHRHYTSRPRRRRMKLPTSTDELKRLYLRRKIQNTCLEREKLLLEISQAKQKHELEITILQKQLYKYK